MFLYMFLHKRYLIEVLVILIIKSRFFLLEVVYTMYVEDVQCIFYKSTIYTECYELN